MMHIFYLLPNNKRDLHPGAALDSIYIMDVFLGVAYNPFKSVEMVESGQTGSSYTVKPITQFLSVVL